MWSVSGDAALLFPRNRAVEIMHWYSKPNHSLKELKFVDEGRKKVVNIIAKLIAEEYPGPSLRKKRRDRQAKSMCKQQG